MPPPADGGMSLLPAPPGKASAAVLGFTNHHVIAADADPGWVMSRLGEARGADLGRAMQPVFLSELGAHLRARPGGQDVLLVAASRATSGLARETVISSTMRNSRVDRALRYRDDVQVATMPGGLVTAGRGLGGRWEVSIEVDPGRRGAGLGRVLADLGRTLVPEGELVWAQVHPANVASLRVFLAAGFRPVGAEVLFTEDSSGPPR